MNYNSSLKITAFAKPIINKFIQNLKKFSEVKFFFIKNEIRRSKYTILKSPHVHKKARDQIEIQHVSSIIFLRNTKSWRYFFNIFKKYNKSPIKIDFKHKYTQKVFFNK
jgi:ribosomal protein S10